MSGLWINMHVPVLSVERAVRNWQRSSCLERISCRFSWPSTENPYQRHTSHQHWSKQSDTLSSQTSKTSPHLPWGSAALFCLYFPSQSYGTQSRFQAEWCHHLHPLRLHLKHTRPVFESFTTWNWTCLSLFLSLSPLRRGGFNNAP